MKRVISIIIILFTLQTMKASEKDSIYLFRDFTKFYKILDECDACGCSAGNGSSGLGTFLNPQFIGLKYFYQNYKVRENIFIKEPKINEYYNTIALWARIPLSKKVELYTTIPYLMLERDINNKITSSGIGDITVMGFYYAVNNVRKSEKTPHNLSFGVGLKIPTGNYSITNNLSTNPSFQLGTNSWDYITGANYMYRKTNWAMQLSTDYTFKTQNKSKYKYGNQWNYMFMGYYLIKLDNNSKLSPKLGFSGEIYQKDEQLKEQLPNTSGYVVFNKFGFEYSVKRFALGMELMLPLSQKLRNGEIKVDLRSSITINYSL